MRRRTSSSLQGLEPRFLADFPALGADGRRYYRGQERNYKLSEPVLAAFTRRTLETYREQLAAGWDPASQVRAMDRMGVDVSYLYPTDGLFMWHFRNMDPATATALTRVETLKISKELFIKVIRENPDAAIELIRILATRLVNTTNQLTRTRSGTRP